MYGAGVAGGESSALAGMATLDHTLLQAGLDQLGEGFTLFDSDHRLVAWNRGFFRTLDFPAHLARIGTPFEDFIRFNAERGEYGPGDPDEQVAVRLAAARAARTHYFERMRPNGRVIAIRGEPLGRRGFISVYRDITEERRAEELIREQTALLEEAVRQRTRDIENANNRLRAINGVNLEISHALRRSEARMRIITDSIPALIAYIDRDLRYSFVNRGYANWFGLSKEAVMGATLEAVLGTQLAVELRGYILAALAGEPQTYEYELRRPGHPIAYARSNLVPDRDEQGQVAGAFVFATDISSERMGRQALLHAARLEAAGHLAGGLAHDFNNLLTILFGNLHALRDSAEHLPELLRLIDPSLAAIRLGADIVRKLMTLARQPTHHPSTVDVGACIRELLPLLRNSLPERIALEVDVASAPMPVLVDADAFESALVNLALNARDAMADGGQIDLHARPDPADAPQMVVVSVSDSGCGMDEETRARAGEAFFTTKAGGAGTGLGLAMVRQCVAQAGGSLTITSAVGVGTRVEMRFPISTQALEPVADILPASGTPRGVDRPLMVLLAEDNADVRHAVRRDLVALGHSVIEAVNGDEALGLITSLPAIDLVLSDVAMPGKLGGEQLARAAQAHRPGLPVVLMTGHAAAVAARDFPVLAKPFTRQDLKRVLAAPPGGRRP